MKKVTSIKIAGGPVDPEKLRESFEKVVKSKKGAALLKRIAKVGGSVRLT